MDNRTLHHNKAKQIKVSSSAPVATDGQNGDMQLVTSSNINNNELLYIKINNEWKIIGLEGRQGFGKGRTIPNIEEIQFKNQNETSGDNTRITIGSKDSTGLSIDGTTLSLAIGGTVQGTSLDAAGTLSHRITIWINGTEYYLYLDPV